MFDLLNFIFNFGLLEQRVEDCDPKEMMAVSQKYYNFFKSQTDIQDIFGDLPMFFHSLSLVNDASLINHGVYRPNCVIKIEYYLYNWQYNDLQLKKSLECKISTTVEHLAKIIWSDSFFTEEIEDKKIIDLLSHMAFKETGELLSLNTKLVQYEKIRENFLKDSSTQLLVFLSSNFYNLAKKSKINNINCVEIESKLINNTQSSEEILQDIHFDQNLTSFEIGPLTLAKDAHEIVKESNIISNSNILANCQIDDDDSKSSSSNKSRKHGVDESKIDLKDNDFQRHALTSDDNENLHQLELPGIINAKISSSESLSESETQTKQIEDLIRSFTIRVIIIDSSLSFSNITLECSIDNNGSNVYTKQSHRILIQNKTSKSNVKQSKPMEFVFKLDKKRLRHESILNFEFVNRFRPKWRPKVQVSLFDEKGYFRSSKFYVPLEFAKECALSTSNISGGASISSSSSIQNRYNLPWTLRNRIDNSMRIKINAYNKFCVLKNFEKRSQKYSNGFIDKSSLIPGSNDIPRLQALIDGHNAPNFYIDFNQMWRDKYIIYHLFPNLLHILSLSKNIDDEYSPYYEFSFLVSNWKEVDNWCALQCIDNKHINFKLRHKICQQLENDQIDKFDLIQILNSLDTEFFLYNCLGLLIFKKLSRDIKLVNELAWYFRSLRSYDPKKLKIVPILMGVLQLFPDIRKKLDIQQKFMTILQYLCDTVKNSAKNLAWVLDSMEENDRKILFMANQIIKDDLELFLSNNKQNITINNKEDINDIEKYDPVDILKPEDICIHDKCCNIIEITLENSNNYRKMLIFEENTDYHQMTFLVRIFRILKSFWINDGINMDLISATKIITATQFSSLRIFERRTSNMNYLFRSSKLQQNSKNYYVKYLKKCMYHCNEEDEKRTFCTHLTDSYIFLVIVNHFMAIKGNRIKCMTISKMGYLEIDVGELTNLSFKIFKDSEKSSISINLEFLFAIFTISDDSIDYKYFMERFCSAFIALRRKSHKIINIFDHAYESFPSISSKMNLKNHIRKIFYLNQSENEARKIIINKLKSAMV